MNTVKTTFGPVTVDEIQDSFKKGVMQAQLRQVATHHYPSMKLGNEFKDALFGADDLGLTTTDYEENRVDWIEVPMGATVEQVAEELAKVPTAHIYKILSSSPILTEDQRRVIKYGLTKEAFVDFKAKNGFDEAETEWTEEMSKLVYDKIVERQTVRYGENNTEGKEPNAPVLHLGKPQYKATFFSKTVRPDLDLRVEEKQVLANISLVEAKVAEQESIKVN